MTGMNFAKSPGMFAEPAFREGFAVLEKLGLVRPRTALSRDSSSLFPNHTHPRATIPTRMLYR